MTRKVLTVALMAGLSFCLLSPGAAAQETAKQKRFWFRPKKDAEVIALRTLAFVDQDGDGRVTAIEFCQHVKTYSFKRLDANTDGKISREEWAVDETGPEAEALFQRWDKNGDGVLTLREFKNTPKAEQVILNLFSTIDLDGDGEIDASELGIKEGE